MSELKLKFNWGTPEIDARITKNIWNMAKGWNTKLPIKTNKLGYQITHITEKANRNEK